MSKRKPVISIPEDKFVDVVCLNCKGTTEHKILCSVDTGGKEPMEYGD
jgi:hypothetical protein